MSDRPGEEEMRRPPSALWSRLEDQPPRESLLQSRWQVERDHHQGLLPGFQASEPQDKRGVGAKNSWVHLCCRPQTHTPSRCAETLLLWPGTHVDTMEELLCLSTSEGDGNGCFSQRLSGEGEVDDRHTPPGNAPRYLRRHRATRVTTHSVEKGSMA